MAPETATAPLGTVRTAMAALCAALLLLAAPVPAMSQVDEGAYLDGRKHGHWVERFANGDVLEGPYLDGRKHGHWVRRHANGDVLEGSYVDGKEHGHWVLRPADGDVLEGSYLDLRVLRAILLVGRNDNPPGADAGIMAPPAASLCTGGREEGLRPLDRPIKRPNPAAS